MRAQAYILPAAFIAFIVGTSAAAHHSYAMFDRNTTIEVVGVVKNVEWKNPHVYIWLYVQNGFGAQDLWPIEFGSGPNGLSRMGWHTDTLKPGDKVSMKVNPLADGRMGGLFVSVTLPNGAVMTQRGAVNSTPAETATTGK